MIKIDKFWMGVFIGVLFIVGNLVLALKMPEDRWVYWLWEIFWCLTLAYAFYLRFMNK
jgi:hypothetical protein